MILSCLCMVRFRLENAQKCYFANVNYFYYDGCYCKTLNLFVLSFFSFDIFGVSFLIRSWLTVCCALAGSRVKLQPYTCRHSDVCIASGSFLRFPGLVENHYCKTFTQNNTLFCFFFVSYFSGFIRVYSSDYAVDPEFAVN